MSGGRSEGPRLDEIVELPIEKDVYRGRGLGRLEGRVVLVPRSHAGERVRARVREIHAGWAEASLVEVIEPSPARREAPCRHASECGGCAYQELSHPEQLRVKEAVLRESLARAGAPFDSELGVHPSPERGWRLRAGLHFAETPAGLRVGFRREGTRRLVEVEECLQLSEGANAAARALRDALASRPAALRSRLHGLDLLESPDHRSLVACLQGRVRSTEASALAAIGPAVAGLTGLGVAGERRALQWLYGSPHVEAQVLGLALRTHVSAFFQANRFLLEPMARAVRELVPEGPGRILDLYCGVGLFALPLAARGEGAVIGVEWSGQAVEDARANARRAGLDRQVKFMAEDVVDALAGLPPEAGERIVVDPPRIGLGRGVVDRLVARQPATIVYVSCDPTTLARDLAWFAAKGYRADAMHLFDLFPDTFHLETVVRLQPVGPRQPMAS